MTRLFILLMAWMIVGCTPYKTFYKETVNAAAGVPSNKVYRLAIDGESQVDIVDYSILNQLASLKLSAISSGEVDRILQLLPNPDNLKVLILDSLHLTALPSNILKFSNLNHISLNHNPHLDLDVSFERLQSLPIEFLNLQHNQLNKLPESIVLLKGLKDLNLSHNAISDPQTYTTLARLPVLRSLWLTNNYLKSLPKTIGELSQLRNFYIEHNQLISLPAEIVGMNNVWVIHAGHNLFRELPAAFATMPSLMLLHSNNCPIASIPEIYDTKQSSVLGLILDNNDLSIEDKKKWKKLMGHYFICSLGND